MSDFSDRPLVAGSIVGLRSFGVDGYGRLTGAVQQHVWTPGENVAACKNTFQTQMFRFAASLSGVKASEHRLAGTDCACGFYAYFDTEHNPHHAPGNALGLIEGYGTVTVGSRGFRAEKARLVGLIHDGPRQRRLPRFGLVAWWYLALALANITYALWAILADGDWTGAFGFAVAPILAFGIWVNREKHEYIRKPMSGSVIPESVRRNYPHLPVYPSVAAALAEHPLAAPEIPSPDTDPEFWTRSAS